MKPKISLVLIIVLLISTVIFFITTFYFIFAFGAAIDKVDQLHEENEWLNTYMERCTTKTNQETSNDSIIDTDYAQNTSDDLTTMQDQNLTFINVSSDFNSYIEKIKNTTDLPFYYLPTGDLNSDIIFTSFVELDETNQSVITQNLSNYDGATISFTQNYEGNNVAISSSLFGVGGTCQESYDLDTKVEGKAPSVCSNENSTSVNFQIDLSGKNPNFTYSTFTAYFDKKIDKSDLEELVGSLERVN